MLWRLHAHRQGDRCRVMVHHPLYAEICGFIYGDERRVEASSADVTMGLLADADATDQQGGPLASLTFRPGDEQRALHSQSGASGSSGASS